MLSVLKQIEDLLDGVSVSGERNWRRMSAAKEILRKLRGRITKITAEQDKGAEKNAADKDAVCGQS